MKTALSRLILATRSVCCTRSAGMSNRLFKSGSQKKTISRVHDGMTSIGFRDSVAISDGR